MYRKLPRLSLGISWLYITAWICAASLCIAQYATAQIPGELIQPNTFGMKATVLGQGTLCVGVPVLAMKAKSFS